MINLLAPNEEKSGKDDKDKEDSKDSFSFESDTPKYYSPVLAICKNGRDPELATITAQTVRKTFRNSITKIVGGIN